jgi:crotonobetainyl-CoA:carnitine CoA-transferase CaiB-like acyl-CoA transferase
MFSALDGDIAIAPSTEAILDRLLCAIELPDLRRDPRFATNALRMQNRSELNRVINEKIATDTQHNWVHRLNDAGVPCGLVQGLPEALSDPQVLHREMVMRVEHPGHGEIRTLGFPVKFSDTPCTVRHPAPDQGVHTQQIIDEWQLDVRASNESERHEPESSAQA